MNLKSFIFSYFSNYVKKNDPNKDLDPENNGRGFLQRYFEMICGEEVDAFVIPKIEDFAKNVADARQILPSFVFYKEQDKGLLEPLFLHYDLRTKILPYIQQLLKMRGTKQNFKFLFEQLGFQTVEIEELFFHLGFDGFDFDAPFAHFDSGIQRWGIFHINLTGDVDLTAEVWTQIWNIIIFNTPLIGILGYIRINGLIVYDSSGKGTLSFLTVQSGKQIVTIENNFGNLIEIDYKDSNTKATKSGKNLVFEHIYPDNSEKEFVLDVQSLSLISSLVLHSEITLLPSLAKLTSLRYFESWFNKTAQVYKFTNSTFKFVNLKALSSGNTFWFEACPNLQEARLELLNGIIRVSDCLKLGLIEQTGQLFQISIINSGFSADSEPQTILKLNDWTFQDWSTWIDVVSAPNIRSLIIKLFNSSNALNAGYLTNLIDLDLELTNLIDVEIDLSGNYHLRSVRLLNFSAKIDLVLTANYNPDVASLEISEPVNENVWYQGFSGMVNIHLYRHKKVKASNMPSLINFTSQDGNLGALAGQVIDITDCDNIENINFIGNFLGTKDDAGLSFKHPNLDTLANLRTIGLQNCNYKTSEIDNIIQIIYERELGILPNPFTYKNGKTLDLSNVDAYLFGAPNEGPSLSVLAKITTLTKYYGWTIKYVSFNESVGTDFNEEDFNLGDFN